MFPLSSVFSQSFLFSFKLYTLFNSAPIHASEPLCLKTFLKHLLYFDVLCSYL
jgi:hypothetical protein